MNVIGEDTVRQLYLKRGETEIRAGAGDYITDQARAYIREHGLRLIIEGGALAGVRENPGIRPAPEAASGFVTEDGRRLSEKPEDMTHLRGNTLVPKTHPCVALRGKLDSLIAELIFFQLSAASGGSKRLIDDLDEVVSFCRELLACEVTERPLSEFSLFGMNATELRARSQHPREHFGIGHPMPSRELGLVFAGLNRLRTIAREAELAAARAFARGERGDLIRGLNRLSSAIYILMLREAAGTNGSE